MGRARDITYGPCVDVDKCCGFVILWHRGVAVHRGCSVSARVSRRMCVIHVSRGAGELRVMRVSTVAVVWSGNLLVGFLCVARSQYGQVSS